MPEELTPYDMPAPKMTRKQVLAAVDRAKGNMIALRNEILALFEGKAHEVMGCDSFVKFAQEYIGIDVSERTIKNHLAAARVERHLVAFQSRRGAIVAPVPLLAALELNKLPPDKMEKVYGLYLSAKDNQHGTPEQMQTELGRLVRAQLAEDAAEKNAIPEPPPPPRPKPNMTPIVAPTYDRGPEHDDDEEDDGDIGEGGWGELVETEEPEPVDVVTEKPLPVAAQPAPVEQDSVQLCAAVKLLRTFHAAYGTQDAESLLRLFHDVKAFLKEYGTP